MKKNIEYERGQILLIVVLVMVTALTIGLSVATRTITGLRSTVEEENSERAFSAAEAGMELSLQSNSSQPRTDFSGNHSYYSTTVTSLSGQELLMNNGGAVIKDDATDIWLSHYPDYASPWTGNLTIFWGGESDNCSPDESVNSQAALEILVISGTKANPQMSRHPVDPCSVRASYNHFENIPSGGGTVSGRSFSYRKSLSISSGLLVRIIPIYSSAVIGVRACDGLGNNCGILPSQGSVIESVGTSDTSQRKIVTYRGYPRLPTEVFPFVVFSPK